MSDGQEKLDELLALRCSNRGVAALAAEVKQLSELGPGDGRNQALNKAACKLGNLVASGELEEGTVFDALIAACDVNGYVAKDGYAAARATLKSGLKAGMRNGARPTPIKANGHDHSKHFVSSYKAIEDRSHVAR
jgi:hypothetical protein